MRLATTHAGLSLSYPMGQLRYGHHLRVMIFTCQAFEDLALVGGVDRLILIESWNFD